MLKMATGRLIRKHFDFGLRFILFLGIFTGVLKTKTVPWLRTLYETHYWVTPVILISTCLNYMVYFICFKLNFAERSILSLLKIMHEDVSPFFWLIFVTLLSIYSRVYWKDSKCCLKAVLFCSKKICTRKRTKLIPLLIFFTGISHHSLIPTCSFLRSQMKSFNSVSVFITHIYGSSFAYIFVCNFFQIACHLSHTCDTLKEYISAVTLKRKENGFYVKGFDIKTLTEKLISLKNATKFTYSYFGQPISSVLIANFFYVIFEITKEMSLSNIKDLNLNNTGRLFPPLVDIIILVTIITSLVWFSDQINIQVWTNY